MIETLSIFGIEISLYFLFWFLGATAVLLGGWVFGRHFGFGFSKSVLYVAGAIALGYLLLWATSWVFGGGKMNGLNFVRVVTFLPIPIYLLTLVLKDPFWKAADFLAPLIPVFHSVSHIGCIFPGCCQGYPSEWGLYSNAAEAVCFPTQPIEAVSSLLVALVLFLMWKKNVQQGKLYAWYLVLFGGTRFLWEFLRDNEKVWGNVSELALHALGALVVGLVALAVMKWIYKRSPRYEK